MSGVEKQARYALRRLVFYRFLGDLLEVPADCFKWLSETFLALSRTVFFLELDAARRYRLLTGADMGVASGDEDRYMGMTTEAWKAAAAEARGDDDE